MINIVRFEGNPTVWNILKRKGKSQRNSRKRNLWAKDHRWRARQNAPHGFTSSFDGPFPWQHGSAYGRSFPRLSVCVWFLCRCCSPVSFMATFLGHDTEPPNGDPPDDFALIFWAAFLGETPWDAVSNQYPEDLADLAYHTVLNDITINSMTRIHRLGRVVNLIELTQNISKQLSHVSSLADSESWIQRCASEDMSKIEIFFHFMVPGPRNSWSVPSWCSLLIPSTRSQHRNSDHFCLRNLRNCDWRKDQGGQDLDPRDKDSYGHWIGLRENLQESMVFTIKCRAFLSHSS